MLLLLAAVCTPGCARQARIARQDAQVRPRQAAVNKGTAQAAEAQKDGAESVGQGAAALPVISREEWVLLDPNHRSAFRGTATKPVGPPDAMVDITDSIGRAIAVGKIEEVAGRISPPQTTSRVVEPSQGKASADARSQQNLGKRHETSKQSMLPVDANAKNLAQSSIPPAPRKAQKKATGVAEAQPQAAENQKLRCDELLADARARDSQAQGREAIKILEQALTLCPDHAEALALRDKIRSNYSPAVSPPARPLAGTTLGQASQNQPRQVPDLNAPVTLDLGGGVKMEFVRIPAGTFSIGSPSGEGARDDDEGPVHRVTISKPFYMAAFEVTQEQYEAITGQKPSQLTGVRLPVDCVSWEDAQKFCDKLSRRDAKRYRLPTEAEWEYACRAGGSGAFSFGPDYSFLSDYAWFANNSEGRSNTVARRRPNAFGLFDMHGNLWEWCSDWYDRDYYQTSPPVDPQGPPNGKDRVLRGGAWKSPAAECRSAVRGWGPPGSKGSQAGFRVVLDVQD